MCITSNPSVNSNWRYSPETLNSGQNRRLSVPCDLEIWWMTLKNYKAPRLRYVKLCASFQSHRCIQTEITARKRSIRVKIGDFLSCVTLKFDGWPWKTIGHLFYVALSVVHHFIAISEFKLKLQSGNAQSGSKSAILNYKAFVWGDVILRVWIGILVPQPFLITLMCDLEIWWMTLKNNRAPILSNIKLCASFRHHMCIQTGVIVWKRLIRIVISVTLTCHW